MKAAVLHAPGDLRVEDVPVPDNLEPDEVLIKVAACGICGSDIGRVMVTGTYNFPTIPGHEFAGTVEKVGGQFAHLQQGDKVAVAPLMPCGKCDDCARGNYSLCEDYNFLGSRTDGAFAQYLKAPAQNVLKVPDNVSLEVAATIEPAAIILHGIHKVDLSLGDAVVVVGCGALGYFALQFAKLSGAQPLIAVDVDEDKLELARQVGADICINPTKIDALAAIKEATKGRGVALALEAAGNDAGRDLSILACAKQGKVVLYGTAYGDVTFSKAAFDKIVREEVEVIGSWNSYSVPFPGKEWFDIMGLLEAGRLEVESLITHRAGLDEAPEIFRKLKDRSFGPYHKILFKPNS
ncbi:galactitol-1-phosphate 5-dehydrogenase [Marinovum sp. 2_MG-2023]|uniref:galactitol-1-phosphate 5-dehydrogenase n=1 Tax=unclassified Marinovum TaxID=2647166 RepID=UPI0026E32BAE|nr:MULTISPECIES: galactitol-1-phosphate 5-dehydrogenase [unclassified Marinovum]MDO6732753.1 galactitol-1-phosphate 5-dehydrogenase [Marinovum sp. 2_MG-2023]MDO6782027.1 galactitol-1-phosphate 5-dehydrogenase [Marinovum sp. 1_MG-2023]